MAVDSAQKRRAALATPLGVRAILPSSGGVDTAFERGAVLSRYLPTASGALTLVSLSGSLTLAGVLAAFKNPSLYLVDIGGSITVSGALAAAKNATLYLVDVAGSMTIIGSLTLSSAVAPAVAAVRFLAHRIAGSLHRRYGN